MVLLTADIGHFRAIGSPFARACFLSFIWGMQRFFRVEGGMSAGARIIQLAGATREPWLLVTVVAMGVIYYVAARKEERKFMSGPLAADRSRTGMFTP